MPRVSIIMPTYNRASLVGRAIESVRSQTYQDWELIIVDDASTDDTPYVLSEWSLRDERIRVFRNERNQYPDISGILNRGLVEAKGVYIARLDDDDYWILPDKLERQVAFLDTHPDHVLVGTGVVVLDATGKELFRYYKKESDSAIRSRALFSNPFTHSTVLYRADAARAAGGYGAWRYAEDWALWLELGKRGNMYNLPQYAIGYMMAGQNKSWVHQRAQARMIMDIIWHYRHFYPHFFSAYLMHAGAYFYSFLPRPVRDLFHQQLSQFKRSL